MFLATHLPWTMSLRRRWMSPVFEAWVHWCRIDDLALGTASAVRVPERASGASSPRPLVSSSPYRHEGRPGGCRSFRAAEPQASSSKPGSGETAVELRLRKWSGGGELLQHGPVGHRPPHPHVDRGVPTSDAQQFARGPVAVTSQQLVAPTAPRRPPGAGAASSGRRPLTGRRK
jgi:hypothetical protein